MASGKTENPVLDEVAAESTESIVALAGHPIHAMMVHFPIAFTFGLVGADLLYWWNGDPFWARAGLWFVGIAFVAAVAAGLAGLTELLLVRGIRNRVASWAHGVAAVMLTALLGVNWGLRLSDPGAVLPEGLALTFLCAVMTGIAGWHGGRLIFDHGIGLMAAEEDEKDPEDEETSAPAPPAPSGKR